MASTWPTDFPRPCFECGYDLRACELSEACPECGTPAAPPPRVEGDCLVIAGPTYLPPRCIWTNQPDNSQPVRHVQAYTSFSVGASVIVAFLAIFLLGDLPLPSYVRLSMQIVVGIAWFVGAACCTKQCKLMYWESKPVKRERNHRQMMVAVWGGGLLVAANIVLQYFIPNTNVATTVALIVTGVFLITMLGPWGVKKEHALRIKKYSDGKFWLSGCGKAFLASIEAEQQQREGNAITATSTPAEPPSD